MKNVMNSILYVIGYVVLVLSIATVIILKDLIPVLYLIYFIIEVICFVTLEIINKKGK